MHEMHIKKKENKNNKMKRIQGGANNNCYKKCAFKRRNARMAK
jgi:hypothetical protein